MAVQKLVLFSRRSVNGVVTWSIFVRTYEGRRLSHYNVGHECAKRIFESVKRSDGVLREVLEAAL